MHIRAYSDEYTKLSTLYYALYHKDHILKVVFQNIIKKGAHKFQLNIHAPKTYQVYQTL